MRHLRIYRAIRLIQRTGSIRKAAEGMAVSPSALNRSVQAFEEELGLPVFDRVPGGVRLTTAGELLVDLLDRHLTEFDDFHTQLVNLRDGVSGVLRLSIGSDIGAGLILAVVHEFEDAFPAVSVEIGLDDTPDTLVRRDVDLALLTNPLTDDAVEVVHVQRLPLVAWQGLSGAPAKGPLPEAAPAGLWDLAATRLLLPPQGTGTRAAVSHLLRRNRIVPGTISTISAAQLAQHLPGGARLAIFPDTVVDPGPGARRLALPLGEVQLSILRAARVPMIRPAQAFLALLQRRLDGAVAS